MNQILPNLVENTRRESVMETALEFFLQLETLRNHANDVLTLLVPVLEKNIELCKKAGPLF